MIRLTTFIVRISLNEAGKVSGVVERVKTGEKQRFESLDALSRLIARMLDKDLEAEKEGGEPK